MLVLQTHNGGARATLVLDTHIWLWWINQDTRLPDWLAAAVADPATAVALSAISLYELSLGAQRGALL